MKKTSDAQLRAVKKFNEGKPRLPASILTEYESELLNRISERFPSKKAAIINGLMLLDEKFNNNIK